MKENKRQQLKIAFFVFSLIIFAMSFLYKGKNQDGKLDKLNLSNSEIKRLNVEVEENEKRITNGIQDVEYKRNNLKTLKAESLKSREFLDTLDLELHLPSFLVDLGLKAKELDIDLIIDYNDKMQVSNNGGYNDYEDNEVDESSDTEDYDDENNGEENNDEEDNNEEIDINNYSSSISYYYDGNLRTIDQMSIPLTVKGTYNNVRSFLYYIDNLDVIDSRHIDLVSDGDNVEGDIMIHIFYKGVRE